MAWKLRAACLSVVVLVGLAAASGPAQGKEEYQIPWDSLRETAQRYLDALVAPKDVATMAKKLKDRTQERMHDMDLDEDSAMRSLMLDWAAGNQGKLKRKESKAIAQACYYFVIFMEKGYFLPGQIRSELNEKNVDEILKHLNEQIEKAQKTKEGRQ
ncbi:MAG: hypothetical protein NTW87_20555 [Planctomycetota bacterium]|nr:hypothetical protein [Planctomycetota bacterium]